MLWSRFFPNGSGPERQQPPRAAPENLGELGREAKELLDNPTLHEALNRVERKLQSSWRNTATGDRDAREEAYRLHWAVEALRAELHLMVGQATMAQRERDGGA